MNTLLALATTMVAAQSTPRIEDYVQRNLKDATLVARVLKGDQRELKKINGDFGQAYRFDTTTVQIKEPFKLRLEATVEDSNVIYIINGPRRLLKIPKSGISQSKDLSTHPGQRQTLMDFGLLTSSLFEELFKSTFVRTDRATGDLVFDLTYPANLNDTSRQRVWVDKEKKLVDKREWYGQDGRQLATFYYEDPKNSGGVWICSQMTVKNVEGKVAGVTRYESIKVNTGLSDSLFGVK